MGQNNKRKANRGGKDPAGLSREELVARLRGLQEELASERKRASQRARRDAQEEELKPYQVELLKLQRHLEAHSKRMIVVFEGRDAAGKGGTIRRVTRYMNEKHYPG